MSYPTISRGDMAADVLQRDFTQIHNRLFRDAELSFKAKGIFGLISTHRDGFGVSPEWLANASTDGVAAVKTGLRELEARGYLVRDQLRRADGTRGPMLYRITDMPSSEPVDGNRPPVVTSDDAGNRRSEPVGGNPPAVEPPAADRPHKKTIPSQKIIVGEKNTSTSPAGPVDTEPPTAPEATDGGGGGGDLRSLAAHITASLDYRGAHPTKTQQQQIRDRLLAALAAGWSMGGLAVYLHLGDAPVRSAAAVYAHRLSPEQLPAPGPSPAPPAAAGGVRGPVLTGTEVESWEDAAARAAKRLDAGYRPFECPPASAYSNQGFGTGTGTDARVAGHVALTRELARREAQAHTPYSNDTWSRPATPEEAAKVPWCGHTDCNPTDRMRDIEDADGFKAVTQCPDCHPAVAWPA